MLDYTKCQFCQPILLQIKCTGFNNGITLHIKSSKFCLQQNRLSQLTPKAPFDASSGIRNSKTNMNNQKGNSTENSVICAYFVLSYTRALSLQKIAHTFWDHFMAQNFSFLLLLCVRISGNIYRPKNIFMCCFMYAISKLDLF